jgi:hypothetical protein
MRLPWQLRLLADTLRIAKHFTHRFLRFVLHLLLPKWLLHHESNLLAGDMLRRLAILARRVRLISGHFGDRGDNFLLHNSFHR